MVASARPRRPYRWRHNWIPRTPGAALIKAKGNQRLADRYMARHGGSSTSTSHKPRVDEGPYFRKSGPELRDLADRGDHEAQRELDRRAARKKAAGGKVGGKREGVPFRPSGERRPTPTAPRSPDRPGGPSETPLERQARESRARAGLDDRWTLPTGAEPGLSTTANRLRPGDVIYTHTDGETVNLPRKVGGTLPRYGKTQRRVERVEKVPGGIVVHFTDGRSTTTPDQAKRFGRVESGQTRVYTPMAHDRDETLPGRPASKRRGGPISNAPEGGFDGPETARDIFGFGSEQHINALNEENKRIAPAGYTLTTKRAEDGSNVLITAMHASDGERVGSIQTIDGAGHVVVGLEDNRYIGTFPTRERGARELARLHAEERAKRSGAERRTAQQRKTAALNKESSKGKKFTPYTYESDGSYYGEKAAAKVKQSFRAGNKTVVIETPMTKQQTQEFLDDITEIVDKANLHDVPVKFYVPSGDRHLRQSSRGVVGAYVIRGTPTVHVNPGIANGRLMSTFEAGAHMGHFMPAAKGVNGRQWTLTHELGHVLDSHNGGDTATIPTNVPSRVSEAGRELHSSHRDALSGYGRTSPAEAYAEAFAQWVHGGPGSSRAADSYAERFGWPRPRTA